MPSARTLIAMLHKGVKRLSSDFDAMVIANDAVNFSVGANLMLVLVAAQEQEWDEVHMAVKQFQNVNLALKYAPKPVVAAPQGMALGGGCEISLRPAPPPEFNPTPVSTKPCMPPAAA